MSSQPLLPTTLEDIAEIARQTPGPISFDCREWSHPFAATEPKGHFLSLEKYAGVIEHDVSDQVVVVRAGTRLSDLQDELAKEGQCLPFPSFDTVQSTATASFDDSLSNLIGYNLPHGLHRQCGSWRDWILGMTVVQADGTIAKCGSKAVKNVAGYDVQKLMIGGRGSLAIIANVVFKTFPLRALPSHQVQVSSALAGRAPNWIQRVKPTDFETVLAANERIVTSFDRESSTLWGIIRPGENLRRFPDDWVLRADQGSRNIEFGDPTVSRLTIRTKEIFDPSRKLNPGAMGIV